MSERRLMKDGLDAVAVHRLGTNIIRVHPEFPLDAFVADSAAKLEGLELKERIGHVSDQLRTHLPQDYAVALAILVDARDHWDKGDPNNALRGFAAWPMFRFIQDHGLQHATASLEAMRRLTSLFSAEFAVRPYINQDPIGVFKVLNTWVTDADPDVRRLASECCRPRLPWATRVPALDADPTPIFNLLKRLVDDDSPYVRRSVANNLSDLCKTHPDQVIDLCETWISAPTEGRRWIVTRATRNLVKSGHPRVWGLLGFTVNPQMDIRNLIVQPDVLTLGQPLNLAFTVCSTGSQPQKVVVDFVIHHQKANGRTTPKVFKLRNVDLAPGGKLEVTKNHPIRPITTRRYYSGVHRVQIMVNGVAMAEGQFTLLVPTK